ncbi:MAG: ferredoxin:protochlorophyllide reductase (ATP-dependent) subunit B [Betaproteobacteria bacterium]|nr:ferredoxin:protochlorophyllide reductase (ATP-dependent) subunit B [Betaproteobacteria bacterium]
MQLTLWTYEGPPHVGAMRIADSMRGVHLVLHAPQGDTYADLLFTMIDRQDRRPPVSYTTFQARDLGGDTANLVTRAVTDALERFQPQVILVGESCTAELIQDQPGSLAQGMRLPVPVVPLELPAYSKKENWGASETFYQLARTLLADRIPPPGTPRPGREGARRPRANLLGPTALAFRCRDDVTEIGILLEKMGVDVNVVAPLGASPDDIRRLPEADFNIDLYPEVSRTLATWLERQFGMPRTKVIPMGVGATRDFIAEVAGLAGLDPAVALAGELPGQASRSSSASRAPWYSRSVDSTYLTGKRVFIFADAAHAIAAARIAAEEMGFTVVGLGTFDRAFARDVREAAAKYGVEALISDDYLEVEKAIAAASPELVLGTQMERHIAKRLGIACAVISSPIHVQDVPARYSPVFGFEGANVLFDAWVHPLMMGLEEHLLQMFREDFEFHDGAAASHLPAASPAAPRPAAAVAPAPPAQAAPAPEAAVPANEPGDPQWTPDGEKELGKIPFFVRGKARRNTERFALERGIRRITVETLYDAKAHFSR